MTTVVARIDLVELERCTDVGWTCDDEVRHFSIIPGLDPRSACVDVTTTVENAQECHQCLLEKSVLMLSQIKTHVRASPETSWEEAG